MEAISLLDKAEHAAKKEAVEWIREALRETFIQGLKSLWKVSKEEDAYTLELSAEGYQSCISLVEELSNRWRSALVKNGHKRTGEWVMEVFSQGKSHLWTRPISTETAGVESSNDEASGDGPNEKSNDQGESDAVSDGREGNVAQDGKITTTLEEEEIPYCRLRRLCRKVHIDDRLPENPLAILQDMGRRGESYWPFDWELIEDAAKMERPKRRHASARNNEGDDLVDNPEMPPPPAKKQKADTETVGRPAMDLSSMKVFSDDFSEEEKERLRTEYIHPEDSDNTKPPPLLLFGAIQKVGNIHYRNRHREDWPERKVNRERKAAIAERLYPNKLDSNLNVRTYRSKVLKTRSRLDESQRFVEMDMGWSLMEVQDPDDESQKRLCAFSSVEIRLEEKNKDDV